VGAVEGLYALTTGTIESFSPQQLVDCSKDGNQGCNGGDMDVAFKFLETNKIVKEADYPYEGTDNSCHVDTSKGVFNIKGFVDVPANST